MTPTYSFRVVRVGDNTVPSPLICCGEGYDQWEDFCYTLSVIQGNGRTVVINTGFQEDPSLIFEMWKNTSPKLQASRTEEQKTRNALRTAGVDPAKVDFLILAPFAAYATGNIHLFDNARICVSRGGWEDFFAPRPTLLPLPREVCIPSEELHYLIDTAWDRLWLLNDEQQIVPGIDVFFAGVHHRSSLAVCVNTSKGKVIWSDAFFKYRNIEQMKPIGIAESMFEAAATYERIRREADIIVPPFDPELFRRHPGGLIA